MRPFARSSPHFAWRPSVFVAALGLAACAVLDPEATGPDSSGTAGSPHLGADFGNAAAHNAAQQVVDPAPATAHSGAPALDGSRAMGALKRYRSGTVIVPQEVETTDFGEVDR